MEKIRNSLGFICSWEHSHSLIKGNPRFFPEKPEDIGATYDKYQAMIKPALSDSFTVLPKADCPDAAPDPASEAAIAS